MGHTHPSPVAPAVGRVFLSFSLFSFSSVLAVHLISQDAREEKKSASSRTLCQSGCDECEPPAESSGCLAAHASVFSPHVWMRQHVQTRAHMQNKHLARKNTVLEFNVFLWD